jgi:hypothetical protein
MQYLSCVWVEPVVKAGEATAKRRTRTAKGQRATNERISSVLCGLSRHSSSCAEHGDLRAALLKATM